MGLPSGFDDPEDEFEAFVARESCRFLQRYGKSDEPFLLVTSFLRPHPPLHPPRSWADRYPVDGIELPPVGDAASYPQWIQKRISQFQSLDPARRREYSAGYRGNLAYVDTCIGEVYQTLEQLGLADDTIVIYTADHGELDGDHGLYEKFCFFDPSVGVPLIVSQPGRFPQGVTSEALVEYFAIFPTIADLTGVPAPHGIEARSFASLVRDPNGKGPEAQFSEYNLRSDRDHYMVRTKRYKYNYNHNDIAELYDLEADPGEKVNVASRPSYARQRAEMHDRLMAWYNPANNPYRRQQAT
jgi:choline-sulfatase